MPLAAFVARLHSLLKVILGLGVHQDHHVLTCKGIFQPVGLQPVLVSGIISPQEQDLTFPSVEFHEILWAHFSSLSRDHWMVAWHYGLSSHSSQLCVTCRLAEDVLSHQPGQKWRSWKGLVSVRGYSASHWHPRGLHAIDNLLGPSVQPVFSPSHGPLTEPLVSQYYGRVKMIIGDTMVVSKDFLSRGRQYPLLSPCPLNWSPHQRGSQVRILKNLQWPICKSMLTAAHLPSCPSWSGNGFLEQLVHHLPRAYSSPGPLSCPSRRQEWLSLSPGPCTPLPVTMLYQQWRVALQGQQPDPSALMGASHQAQHTWLVQFVFPNLDPVTFLILEGALRR